MRWQRAPDVRAGGGGEGGGGDPGPGGRGTEVEPEPRWKGRAGVGGVGLWKGLARYTLVALNVTAPSLVLLDL